MTRLLDPQQTLCYVSDFSMKRTTPDSSSGMRIWYRKAAWLLFRSPGNSPSGGHLTHHILLCMTDVDCWFPEVV